MSPLHRGRKISLALASLLACVCLWAPPVLAAVHADLNGDGLPDSVDLLQQPRGSMVVQLSGAAAAVLPLGDPIVSVAAADLDHDGDLDLGALTQHHQLLIWLNGGQGHFQAVHGSTAPPRLSRSHAPSASETSDADPSAAQLTPGVAGFFSPSRWQWPVPAPGRRIPRPSSTAASADLRHPHHGRAPPAFTSPL